MQDLSKVADGAVVSGEQDGDELIQHWLRKKLTSETEKDVFNKLIDRVGKILISEALQLTGNNRTRAATILGISRPTLLSKIEKYGIQVETSVKR